MRLNLRVVFLLSAVAATGLLARNFHTQANTKELNERSLLNEFSCQR